MELVETGNFMPDEQELCWKCKEGLAGVAFSVYLHCHHKPKEKTKCWCVNLFHAGGILTKETNTIFGFVSLNFCPQCGRNLQSLMVAPNDLRGQVRP